MDLRDFRVVVSPLATLAFELCVVGDTGLETWWVRCRHGARGGAGGAGFHDANVAPWPREMNACVSVSVSPFCHFTISQSKWPRALDDFPPL